MQKRIGLSSYAKRKSLKVYAIGGVQKCADRFIDCSPFEVLAYFKGAEEVITDTSMVRFSLLLRTNHSPPLFVRAWKQLWKRGEAFGFVESTWFGLQDDV